MLPTTIFATLLAFAAAAPHGGPSVKTGDICGNGNTVRCCNDDSVTNKVTGPSVLSDLDLRHLLDLSCPTIPISLLLSLPLDSKCRQQSICCGKQQQNGLVNLGCTPITLF
ncbi:hypothetical protein NHJ13734_007644 [Beauveria thailandica]